MEDGILDFNMEDVMDLDCHVEYSRTCASGDICICPGCGKESSVGEDITRKLKKPCCK